jgi:hypothetical protein
VGTGALGQPGPELEVTGQAGDQAFIADLGKVGGASSFLAGRGLFGGGRHRVGLGRAIIGPVDV